MTFTYASVDEWQTLLICADPENHKVYTYANHHRAHPGKDTTYVLDFVNSSEEILEAFRAYYDTAELEATTDPNLIYNLRQKLDATGHYDDYEVNRVAAVEVNPAAKQSDLIAAIEPVADRLLKLFKVAQERLASTVGRHPEDTPTTTVPWDCYLEAIKAEPEIIVEQDGSRRTIHYARMVQKAEQQGDEVRVWFRNVSDAVEFKLRFCEP